MVLTKDMGEARVPALGADEPVDEAIELDPWLVVVTLELLVDVTSATLEVLILLAEATLAMLALLKLALMELAKSEAVGLAAGEP